MTKLKKWMKSEYLLYIIGILIYIVLFIYFILLGDNIYVSFVDQLDCEMEYYMLRASAWPNIFQQTFPQFMSGHAMVQVASFLTIFLYVIFSPIHAFVINLMAVRLFGFLGMMMLLRRIGIKREIAFVAAMTYSVLPLFSVYGLTAFGMPLLVASFMDLRDGRHLVRSHAAILLYGAASSVVLSGYYVVPLVFFYVLFLRCTKKNAAYGQMLLGGGELFVVYIVTNWDLLSSVIFQTDNLPLSHKSAYVISAENEWERFKAFIMGSMQHTPADSKPIYILLIVVAFSLFLYRFIRKRNMDGTILILWKNTLICAAAIVVSAALAAIYDGQIGYAFRNHFLKGSALYGFSADRIMWAKPMLLFVMFANLLGIVAFFCRKISRYVAIIAVVAIIGLSSYRNIYNSDLFLNLLISVGERSYSELTWHNYFSEEVYAQVRDYIGLNQEDYYIASVGIPPHAALYNGFYCVDGYANTYDLEYKNYFYNIVEPEYTREGAEAILQNFTEWGSRCYIVSLEIGADLWIPKFKQKPVTLYINTEPMKALGCKYLISADPIKNCDEIGIAYLSYFETEESIWGIYLYEIE